MGLQKGFLSGFIDMPSLDGSREEIVKAPFGWPGGKSKALDYILPNLPYYDGYIEPFGGSFAVGLARKPSKLEVYNDRFSGVVDFYRCIANKDLLEKLVERLGIHVHSRELFLENRDTWIDTTDPVERAARWYYYIETSFASRGRNFGRATSAPNTFASQLLRKLPNLQRVHDRIHTITFENQPWEQIIKDYDSPNHVIYCDPPYLNSYDGSYQHNMDESDHRRLLEAVFKCRAFVAVSGYKHPLYDEYKWDRVLDWKQNVSSKSGSKNTSSYDGSDKYEATEMLYIKELH